MIDEIRHCREIVAIDEFSFREDRGMKEKEHKSRRREGKWEGEGHRRSIWGEVDRVAGVTWKGSGSRRKGRVVCLLGKKPAIGLARVGRATRGTVGVGSVGVKLRTQRTQLDAESIAPFLFPSPSGFHLSLSSFTGVQ